MTKRPARRSQIVERAPFHRGAYVTQAVQAQRATDFLRSHGIDLPLLGSPETGSVRGSNRSEITPAFTYRAVFGETDPDGPTITTADGVTMLVEEYESLIAEPDIDSVSQHATTAHRDRRLMSGASITRVRYVGPCIHRTTIGFPCRTVTGRWSMSKAGALTFAECPAACPKDCKADHRHSRHQHRETGTTYVHQTMPYGDDGMARRTATTTIVVGRDFRTGADVTSTVVRPLSKAQGRRTRRASMGAWTDATYTAPDPTVTAMGAYVTTVPREAIATVSHPFQSHQSSYSGDAVVREVATRWYVKDDDGTTYGLTDPDYSPVSDVYRGAAMPAGGRLTDAETTDTRTVTVRSWVKASREYATLPADWARPAFLPTRVKADAAGRPKGSVLAIGTTEGLRKRIANDPDAMALAARVLLAAEHAWTTNGQPVTAEQGLTLTVTLPPNGGPTLTIAQRDGTTTTGTYKARASLVRRAVASVLMQ